MAAIDGARPRDAFLFGGLFGFVFWVAAIPWIAYTVSTFGEVGPALGLLALGITAGLCAVPFALMSGIVSLVSPRTGPGLVLTWGAAWVAQEGFRTYIWIFGGFPWALLGSALADHPILVQSASLGGIELASFLVAALDAALFAALTRPDRTKRLLWLLGSAAAALLVVAAGALRLGGAREASTILVVGIVQPNVEQKARWDEASSSREWSHLVAQTRRLVAADRPDVVLWPESASPYSWPWNEAYRAAVPALCRELRTTILLNTVWSDEPGRADAPYYNAALLVTADGPVLPPYRKQRLVPFGEFVPLASLLRFIGPITRAVPGGFTPSPTSQLVPLGNLRLGGAICYEIVYPWIPRGHVRAGADILFTLTNDAWYGRMGAQRQHWQAAVMRAVETGRPLIRAAITGISGAVAPDGTVLDILGPGRRGALVVPLPPPTGPVPAVALGESVLLVCAAGLAAAILRRVSRPREAGAARARDARAA